MVNKLCKAQLGVKCVYKMNLKPHTVCGHTDECIFQELIDAKRHGTDLKERAADLPAIVHGQVR